MVSNSAKLDSSTLNLESLRVTVPDMAQTKSWRKKKKKKNKNNNEANWMVSNSAQLNRRTKQHIQFGVSACNGSRDMGRTKSWRTKKKKKKKGGENERRQSHIASPTGIANERMIPHMTTDISVILEETISKSSLVTQQVKFNMTLISSLMIP